MDPLISVIIPIYNPGKYLHRCLDSVIGQTYRNIEIILVDDGSSDGSDLTCDEYKDIDSRIIVIHQKNSGVSVARNRALDIAGGEYISFIDSDDYVTADFIESLYRCISENDADISICALEKIGGVNIQTGQYDDGFSSQEILLDNRKLLDRNELWFHSIDSNLIGTYLWNKMFKASLLNGMRLDPQLSIGEDMVFLVQYLLKVKKAYYIPETLYKYQVNERSALNSANPANSEAMIRKMKSSLLSTELIQEYTHDEDIEIRNYVSYRKVRSSLWCMFKMIIVNVYNRGIADEIVLNVKENYKGYKAVKYGSRIQNTAVSMLRLSPRVLFVCGRIAMKLFPSKMYSYSRD